VCGNLELSNILTLATGPRVLLLDEVIAGLNPVETTAMVELIRQIRDRGVSIIMIEHVMNAVMNLSTACWCSTTAARSSRGRPPRSPPTRG
jgi:branched-chain amino acid transport system ATP-binding protein